MSAPHCAARECRPGGARGAAVMARPEAGRGGVTLPGLAGADTGERRGEGGGDVVVGCCLLERRLVIASHTLLIRTNYVVDATK